jgi:pyridoxamine 5'-phosphate oxidase
MDLPTLERMQQRTNYVKGELNEDLIGNDPFALFADWLSAAEKAGLPDHNAMALSTAGSASISCRMVLLRAFDARGFVFYTNYNSRKAMDMERDSRSALTLFWPSLERQIRIEGKSERIEPVESDAYFASRPRASQISAWSSDQSRAVESRSKLEERYARWEERFAGSDVPRPEHWGGLRVKPVRIEFWHGRADRMHDRIAFERFADGTWQRMRLQP